MGLKLAKALGAHVAASTISPSKRDDALALAADEVIVSRDAAEMAAHAGSRMSLLSKPRSVVDAGHRIAI
jgi:uncharacterized zinc-type alcohol dehydrogenase-like protein